MHKQFRSAQVLLFSLLFSLLLLLVQLLLLLVMYVVKSLTPIIFVSYFLLCLILFFPFGVFMLR